MPTIIDSDKPIIKAAVGSNCKIFTATMVKLYVSHPNPRNWTDANKMGAIVLYRDDNRKGAPFFSLVDLISGRVVWEHEIYRNFVYYEDAPFFHSFPSDKFLIGISFADQNEASQFKGIVLRKLDLIFNGNVPVPPSKNPRHKFL